MSALPATALRAESRESAGMMLPPLLWHPVQAAAEAKAKPKATVR